MGIITELNRTDYGLEGWVSTTTFLGEIEFVAREGVTLEYIEACVRYLNSLSEQIFDDLFEATVRMYHDHLRRTGQPVNEHEPPSGITLTGNPALSVHKPRYNARPAVHLSLSCAWDEEHPIEWFVRDDKVVCVCMGPLLADPWADFSETESWNFA